MPAGWEKARAYLAQQPGYLSTRLYRALAPDARFTFVNIAEWVSPEAFRPPFAREPSRR